MDKTHINAQHHKLKVIQHNKLKFIQLAKFLARLVSDRLAGRPAGPTHYLERISKRSAYV